MKKINKVKESTMLEGASETKTNDGEKGIGICTACNHSS